MQRVRAWLLVIAGLAFAAWLLVECWSAFQSGVVSIPLGRRRSSVLVTLVRGENPAYFFLALAFATLVAVIVLLGAVWQGRSLVAGPRSTREVAARAITAPLEQAAPSGLAPLWWGLLIAAVCFLLYVAA